MNAGGQPLPLASLLQALARDVVSTQAELDQSFVAARAESAQTAGAPAPVWYRLENVKIGLGMRTAVRDDLGLAAGSARDEAAGAAAASPQLLCQLPDPLAVALYGSERVTSTWIAVEIAPLSVPVER